MAGDNKGKVIGIDLGGTNIKAAAVTNEGKLVTKLEWATEAEQGVGHVVQRLQSIARAVASEAGWIWSDVAGIGIGIPGFLDFQAGVVERAVNIGWEQVPILDIMQRELGVPVYFDNDANAAAIGEAWVGGGRGFRHVVAVTIGTGIGGGILIDGQIYRGANGMAGEFGHMVMDWGHGHVCNCGQTGCLETIASATAMLRSARQAVERGETTALASYDTESLTTRLVIDEARNGDAVAGRIVRHAMETLGMALSYIGNALNPERIVIGGGVSKAGDVLFSPILTGFQQGALSRVQEACKIVPAELGNDAGVLGAAKLAVR
jgi:glucokinase